MKKTAAVLLAMIMMLFAACALAAPEVTAGNGGIYTYAANLLTLKAAGEYTVSNWNNGDGVPTEGRIVIESGVDGSVTLKLKDVHLDAGSNDALTWFNAWNTVDCWLTVELVDSSLEGDSGVSVINYSGDVGVTVAGENAKITGEINGINAVIEDRSGAVHDAFVTVSASNSVIAGGHNGILIRNKKGPSTVTVTAQAAGTEIKGISRNGIHAVAIGDVSVTAAAENMKVTGSEYGVHAEVSDEAGNAAVTVSGKGAAVTGGKYGAYARGNDASVTVSGSGAAVSGEMNGIEAQATNGDASVTVKNAGKIIGGIQARSQMEGSTTVTVTDVEEISGDCGIYASAYTGDVTVNAKNVGKMSGLMEGVAAESNYGNVSVNLADVQEVFGHSNGIRVQSYWKSSELTLGGNMTVTGEREDAIVVTQGNIGLSGTLQLDSENYPGIVAQIYESQTDEEPVKTLTALTAQDVKDYHKVRTVFASAAGLPGTGDNSQLMLYMAMLGIAAIGLCAMKRRSA